MAAMKVTTSAAMRARDVSRPHAEQLAYAEAAEADAVGGRTAAPAAAAPVAADPVAAKAVDRGPGSGVPKAAVGPGTTADQGSGDPESAGSEAPRGGRRRWRSRGSGRGRASR
ncbi:MAG TPA: hypothetical protein VKU77_29540 [Streptosporangiaceae bacterium]|nr:hypothetical protein [Streptosporangiaceae bacterium]